jgi:hypothetical protein
MPAPHRWLKKETTMQGPKTHEQQRRILERKPDLNSQPAPSTPRPHRDARQSEFPVSRGGMNQESKHNKHNEGEQPGHKPQQHTEKG